MYRRRGRLAVKSTHLGWADHLLLSRRDAKGQIKIMDFGLASLTDRSKLTRMDETMGTVTYMSSEQIYGMDLDHRTDVLTLSSSLLSRSTIAGFSDQRL
jgi:serine/threonine protein kinase